MVNFLQNRFFIKTKKHIPLSATLIASTLLAFTPKEHVLAEEVEENRNEMNINDLHTKYHSLLTQVEAGENPSDNEDVASGADSETNDLASLQKELLILVEEDGNIELAQKLRQEKLNADELEALFNELIESSNAEEKNKDVEQPEEPAASEELLAEEEVAEEEVAEEEVAEEEVAEEEIVEEEVAEEEIVEEEIIEEEVAEEEVAEEEIAEEEVAEKEVAEEEIAEEEVAEKEVVEDTEVPKINEKPKAKTEKAPTITATPFTNKTISYTVRAGDTLSKIARAHNVSVSYLAKLNNIKNVNFIRVGQVIMIHGQKTENEVVEDLNNLGRPLSNQEFIEFLGKYAAVAAKEQNLYASVMIAQAALESGFGTSGLSAAPNYNLYGMKGRYNGQSVLMRTREYSSSKGWHYVNAHFKKYPSYLESLLDHAAYIRRGPSWGPNFYSGVWRENTSSYRDATAWLQGRYATDPAYANKLNQIIERFNLTRFDSLAEDDLVEQPPANESNPGDITQPPADKETPDSPQENTEISTYRVKRGDTLSHIALAHNMTVHELKSLNNLKSDLILVNQVLKVKIKVAESKPTPPPTPEVSVPGESNTTTYTVKRGDTLSHIALAHNMTVNELKSLNNLTSDLILIGQRLQVKGSVAESKPTPPAPSTPGASTNGNYTVKRGDTLSHIALAHNMTVNELKSLNNLTSDLILIGQRLQVKESVAESKPTPPAPSTPGASTNGNYTVKRGDTLWQIARTHQTTVAKLKQENKLQTDRIYIGQQLKISASSQSQTSNRPQSYQIKAGDTLSHLARQFNTTVRELKAKNNLTSDLIFVNQVIQI